MKVNSDQIMSYLSKNSPISRVFLLSGDEPLQMMEAADEIRKHAMNQGFTERDVLHADNKFDWSTLNGASNSLSLFCDKKIIDLRIETKTPGRIGSQAIRDYTQNPPDDKILLIQIAKLDRGARNSAWVKAIDKVGVVTNIWELSTPQTMSWLAKRLHDNGLRATPDAVRLLTERIEGNLLAGEQEINKLKLLYQKDGSDGNKETLIDEEQVLSAVSDSSRYSIFDLSNAVMLGDAHRIQHIHHNLKEEGVPVQLFLWALTDLSRQLYTASFSLKNGAQMSQVMAKIPFPRQKPFQVALQRMGQANWTEIFQKNSEIDRLSKGQSEIANKGMGRVWSDLLELALILANHKVIKS